MRQRDKLIIADYMTTSLTRKEIGEKYGVSGEWVRLVGKSVGFNKNRMRCPICGKKAKTRVYCSTGCRKTSVTYDVTVEKTCKQCKQGFFPLRNWRKQRGRGKYCSMDCYIKDKKLKALR